METSVVHVSPARPLTGDLPDPKCPRTPEAGVSAAVLEGDAIRTRWDGNTRLLGELAAMLLEDCPEWLAELAGALRRGDAARLEFTAHLLRGSVSAVGPC